MSNYALTTDGDSTVQVEKRLRKYLPGIDVRLWPYSATQAIIASSLVTVLEREYPNVGAGPLLKVLGVAGIRAVTDEETVHLLQGRDPDQLPARIVERVASRWPGVDWHLAIAKVPEGWALLGGPDQIAWAGVRVGHIDTGFTEHTALGFPAASWIDVAQARSFFPAAPSGEGSMFPMEAAPGMDNLVGISAGHGTRMQGTICGWAPNAAGGAFYGVAPKVPLVPVRITDSVWINHAQRQFGEAVTHLVGAARVNVISVSLGVFAGVVVKEMRRAVNDAYDAGVIMVCAAGNYVNSVVAPARLSRTLAVAGVNQDLTWWSGSSHGPAADWSAPAANLRRATTSKPGRYGYGAGGDGTSYATAMTAGAAALWLARHTAALDAQYPMPWQRVEAFKLLATQTTFKPPHWQPGSFGSGVLDVQALLTAPLPPASALVQAAPA
jgi:Subtilase family